jgi:hypothetical protein
VEKWENNINTAEKWQLHQCQKQDHIACNDFTLKIWKDVYNLTWARQLSSFQAKVLYCSSNCFLDRKRNRIIHSHTHCFPNLRISNFCPIWQVELETEITSVKGKGKLFQCRNKSWTGTLEYLWESKGRHHSNF